MDLRPPLNTHISPKDFREFYWLKKELMAFCKQEGLRTSGSKTEITERIIHFLETGKKETYVSTSKPSSTFDWQQEALSLETVITDNYKNTENVRNFFEQELGKGFKFNVKFMNWMKSHVGKTLQEATEAWKKIKMEDKTSKRPKEIAPQFEYNRYLRDFLADNPQLTREVGIELWKIKRSLRGDNVYRKEDLAYLTKK